MRTGKDRRTKITEEGVQKLKHAIPGLNVSYENPLGGIISIHTTEIKENEPEIVDQKINKNAKNP